MAQFQCDKTTALVRTDKGLVKGYLHNGLSIFKGIPYAQAKRFRAPEPLSPWEGVLDASSYGKVCPLLEQDNPTAELRIPHRYWPMDENCQNLNIWTPGTDSSARPVLVWLHGGGFRAGSSIEQIAYDGAAMATHGDVVVVSLNHRLNVIGYLDLSEYGPEYANSGNAGGDDIIAALQWVHDNIAAFGGDPANVTVFGQSGGGAKVLTLLQSPAADGLYAKGVVMSGVLNSLHADAPGSAKPLVEALLAELKLTSVKELETVEYAPLAKAYRKVAPRIQAEGHYAGDYPRTNAFYLGDPNTVPCRPETAHIPLLIGTTFAEFFSFTAPALDAAAMTAEERVAAVAEVLGAPAAEKLVPMFRAAYPGRPETDLLALDCIFRTPQLQLVSRRAALNSSTYAYLFNMTQPIDGGSLPWHCSDIPYFFHNIHLAEYTQGATEPATLAGDMQNAMFSALMAFARTGDPNCPALPVWPACTPDAEHTMIFDENLRVETNHDRALLPALASVMLPLFLARRAAGKAKLQH